MEITKPCLSVTYKWKSLYYISKIGFQSKYGGDQIISMGYLFNLVNLLCKNNILPKFVQIQNKKMHFLKRGSVRNTIQILVTQGNDFYMYQKKRLNGLVSERKLKSF